jgi:hypothetical protein
VVSSTEVESPADVDVSTDDGGSEKVVSIPEYPPLEDVDVAVFPRTVVAGRAMSAAEFAPPIILVWVGSELVRGACIASTGLAAAGLVVAVIEVKGKDGPRGKVGSPGCDSRSPVGELFLRQAERKPFRDLCCDCAGLDSKLRPAVGGCSPCLDIMFKTQGGQLCLGWL